MTYKTLFLVVKCIYTRSVKLSDIRKLKNALAIYAQYVAGNKHLPSNWNCSQYVGLNAPILRGTSWSQDPHFFLLYTAGSSSFYWASVTNAPNVLQPYWLIVLPLDVPDLTASLLL